MKRITFVKIESSERTTLGANIELFIEKKSSIKIHYRNKTRKSIPDGQMEVT